MEAVKRFFLMSNQNWTPASNRSRKRVGWSST